MVRHRMWHAALAAANPMTMSFEDWKPIIRSSIAAWIGLILVIDSKTIRVLGQASFLVLIVSSADPPSAPVVKVLYDAIYSLLFICISWTWYIIASRSAIAARTNVYAQASLTLPTSDGFTCASTPQQCFTAAIFAGEYVEGRSSVIYAVFLYLGMIVFLYVKIKYPARLFSVIFGMISIIIPFNYGPLFPYWYPQLGETFIIPIGIQLTINIACACIFWPETMNHAYTKQLHKLLSSIKTLTETQREILASDPRDGEDWESHSNIKDQVRGARMGLGAFVPLDSFLDKEFHYSRLGAADLREVSLLCRDVCLKLGGFTVFYDLVTSHMEAWEIKSEKSIHTPARYANDVPRESSEHEKHTSATPSRTPSGAVTPMTPITPAEHAEGHIQHNDHLDQVSDRLRASDERARHKKLKRQHFKKNHSMQNLLHEALNHQYKPVGVFEMHQYTEREQRFPRKAEVEFLIKMMSIVAHESNALFDAMLSALDVVCEYLTVSNGDRVYQRILRRKKPKDMQAPLTSARDALQCAWDQFNAEGRLKMCAPYHKLNADDFFDKTPHRPLMRMYYLEFYLMRFSHTVIVLTQKCLDLETSRPRPTLHWPTSFFMLKFSGHKEANKTPTAQDEGHMEEGDEGGLSEPDDDYETEVRDPDHEPPRHFGHLIGSALVKALRVFKDPTFLFAYKAAALVVLVALPGFLRASAGWFYENRGLWAVIMAAFSQAPFTGDTIFVFFCRTIGTFLGAVLGMLVWYVGNGNGQGQPYGFAAIMVLALPAVFFIRLKFVYISPQPAIILVLTFVLIVGYSWQNAHLPAQVNLGVGWEIAWRRFLVVLVGITAAFIWSFIPKPITGRQVVRRRLAQGVFDIGNIYVQVSNFARDPHNKKPTEEEIRQMVVRANGKLMIIHQRMSFTQFEPPIQGPWPKQKYMRLLTLQRELLDLMVAFVNNLAHMEHSEWRIPLLRRTGWFSRDLIGDCLAVLFMTGNAIKTGNALPQLVPCPLLDRFAKQMDKIQETQSEGSLPRVLTRETLEDPCYASFAVGSVISFAIVHRIDELLTLAKELVGERWHSTHWLNRHEYERLDVV